jgi:hypothetical protein
MPDKPGSKSDALNSQIRAIMDGLTGPWAQQLWRWKSPEREQQAAHLLEFPVPTTKFPLFENFSLPI